MSGTSHASVPICYGSKRPAGSTDAAGAALCATRERRYLVSMGGPQKPGPESTDKHVKTRDISAYSVPYQDATLVTLGYQRGIQLPELEAGGPVTASSMRLHARWAGGIALRERLRGAHLAASWQSVGWRGAKRSPSVSVCERMCFAPLYPSTHRLRALAALIARVASSLSPELEVAGTTGCLLHPRSSVRFAQKMGTRASRELEHSGLSMRNCFTLTSCHYGRTALLPTSPGETCALSRLTQHAAPEPHTTSALTIKPHSQSHSRAHSISPHVSDDGPTPLTAVRQRSYADDLVAKLSGIFLREGLDRFVMSAVRGQVVANWYQSCAWRKAISSQSVGWAKAMRATM